MTNLHDDLLEQAFHLATREDKNPRQASLRRSVSACYYALFHLLIDAATKRAFPGDDRALLRNHLARTIAHRHIKNVAQQFSKDSMSKELRSVSGEKSIDKRLFSVAETFLILHQTRNDADYDLNKKFVKREVLGLIGMTKEAFNCWKEIHKTVQADLFLFKLHHQELLKK